MIRKVQANENRKTNRKTKTILGRTILRSEARKSTQGRAKRSMNCDAEKAGLSGCPHSVSWVLKGADKKMHSCGTHLNRVALQMVKLGLEFMTLQLEDNLWMSRNLSTDWLNLYSISGCLGTVL